MEKKKVHFIAIGGIGMSALAKILLEQGYAVSGSDEKKSAVTDRLTSLGAVIHIGHHGTNVPEDCDEIIFSSAIREDNPEIVRAKELGIKLTHRGDLLARLFNAGKGIAVAGAHGKTTTSGMVAHIFEKCGKDPSIAIGGILPLIASNAKKGEGDLWAVEADESDGSFLNLKPNLAVITNIEPEHLQHYGSETNLTTAFYDFCSQSNDVILCLDDRRTRDLSEHYPKAFYSYGLTGEDVELTAKNIRHSGRSGEAEVWFKGKKVADLKLEIPGDHNISNALAALYCAYLQGISFADAAASLASFGGMGRRFEVLYDEDDLVVVDDYAHHPTEVQATIKAAKDCGYQRVIAVFQPHRYSRVRELYKEFGESFYEADIVVIDEIYSAWEDVIEGISSQMIVDELVKNGVKPFYLRDKKDIIAFLLKEKQPGDIILLMGAGDIRGLTEEFCRILTEGKNER